MPVVVLDTNIVQVMGGQPGWVDESGDRESDSKFLQHPDWYREEIGALSTINLAIPRLYSTAFVPPQEVIQELARTNRRSARESLVGWGGKIAAWADRWFWQELEAKHAAKIREDWASAQTLDLSILPHEGDRAIAMVAYALRSCHSQVLTLDRRSFWGHRARLAEMGVVVRLPSELWKEIASSL